MFRKKLRGYRAAFRVETHRAAAEQLRREDPQTYQQILMMAEGEAADAAAKDPDAFVALFLAAAEDEGVIGAPAAPSPDAPSEAAPFCNGTDRKPHPPIKTTPVEDPFEPTYRCPTCGREQRISAAEAAERAVQPKVGRELFARGSAGAQTEELVERVLEQLLEMDAEAGGPRQYPLWALRQFVKSMVITEGAPDRMPTVVASYDDPTPEKPQYEQVLDRVLEEEDLADVAEEVFAAVTISSDDWEQMTEEERRKVLERRPGEALAEASEDYEAGLETDTSFEEMPLNGELFDEDSEHEAYWAIVEGILDGVDPEEVPEITRQMSLNQVQHLLSLQRTSGFDYWVQDLAGTLCDAYFLADAEEWELDAEVASELIEECMFALNKSRLAVGTGEVTKAEYSTWISIVLNGMHSELGEWEPLNEYLRAEGAWERLDSLYPAYLARHKTEPRAGDVEQWRLANQLAWRNGILLNLLYRLGYLSAEPGHRGFDSGDRPLSGTLFELDPQQYQMTAAQLMQVTAHAVPDVAKELYWHLIGPLVDQKLARNYGQWLRDTFESGYVLCLSEAWEGLDEDMLDELIDEGLRTVIREKDSRDPDILLADPEYRIRNVSYGIAGGTPYFTRLTQYLEGQKAFQRIAGLGEMMLTGVAASGAIKRRHAAKLESPLRLSFLLGVSVAVLDQLGEVPPEMPARLL